MRDRRFYDLEHASIGDFVPIGRDGVSFGSLHLEVVSEGRLQADVVKRGHFLSVRDTPGVKNCPLRKLGDAVGALFKALVLFNTQLAIALEGKEVALSCL